MSSVIWRPVCSRLKVLRWVHFCDNADDNYDRYLILVENWIDDSFKEFNMILPYTRQKLIYNDNAKSIYKW